MLKRRIATVGSVVTILVVLTTCSTALADEALPPTVTVDPVAVPGGGELAPNGDPAPGAQPAAPGADAVLPQVDEPAADHAHAAANIAPAPIAAPAPAPAPVVAHGGGTAPATAPAPTAGGTQSTQTAPSGELPYTGLGQTLLLIVLAGMLVPLGVLAWSFARHGDARILRRHLAEPRFRWTSR